MSILSRITSGASTLVKNIHVTQSGVLLGRYSSGAGKAQEITLGSGVTVTGGELTVTPAWSDITGKPTEFTPAAHTHTFSSLTSKPTTLAGYGITDAAASTHTHALSSLTQSGAFSKQVAMWNGGNWVPSAVSYLDLTDVPTAVPLTASKVVANAAARLALSLADAEGFAVVEADTGKSYMLVEGGNPATSGDWTQIGDRDIQQSDVSGLTSSLSAKVETSILSTTGGANKVPQIDGNGDFRTTPINASSGVIPPPIRVSARQRIAFENYSGTPGYGAIWLYPDHSASGLASVNPGGGHHELIYEAGRHCFYWDDGFQIGNADSARGNRFVYIRNLGTASSGDPTRESVPVWMDGQVYNGGSPITSKIGLQWEPAGDHAGELVFAISGSTYIDAGNQNKLKNLAGAVFPFSVTQNGPKVGTGKVITFGDGSTMASAPTPYQARVGNATLVGGTVDVADDSITNMTVIHLTRKTAGGTIGDLTYSKDPGVGFTINSASGTDTSRVSYLLNEGTVADNAPTISGSNGVGDTLTVASGGGTGTYQWYSNGVAVSGQTASTYVIRHQDIGLPITCREDGTPSNAITAWKPSDESGYFADFRADAGLYQTTGGAAATAHGDPVGEWQDQSGNARHLSQSTTTKRPLLDLTTRAGYPHLDFDSTDDALQRIITLNSPVTAFVVGEYKSVQGNKAILRTGDSGNTMRLYQYDPDQLRNGNAISADGSFPVNTRKIITGRTTSALHGIRIDSGSEVTSTETTVNGFGIYVSQSAGGGGADVRVYAVLIYAADLDSAAQARVRAYLKAKWGTP